MSGDEELLSVDEAHRLWTWALALLEQPREHRGIRTTQDNTDLCGNALVLAAYAATRGSDFRWVADVPRVLELVAGWLMDNSAPRWEQALRSLALLLDARAPIDRRVEKLAKSPDARVRRHIADGLDPSDPKALALLERLARDPDPSTRMKAQQKLPETKVSAWWFGAFDTDPIPRVEGGAPNEAIIAALRTVADFAELPHELRMGQQEAFEQALAELPPHLRFEFAGRFLPWDWAPEYGRRVVEVLARTREGQLALGDIVQRRFRSGRAFHFLSVLQVYLDPLHKEKRQELLAVWLERATSDAHSVHGPMIELLAYVMRSAWAEGGDPTPILDAWERIAGREESALLQVSLVGTLEHADLSEPRIFGRIVNLAEQHEELDSLLERSLRQVDDVTGRAFVERCMASDDDTFHGIAARHLVTSLYDPEIDGPRERVFERLWADQSSREAIFERHDLAECLSPYLREKLRKDQLGAKEAEATIQTIGRLFGGVVGSPSENRRIEAREHAAEWLEGRPEQGPPTEEEWEHCRSLQSGEPAENDRAAWASLRLRPPGPLAPFEREIVDRTIEQWRKLVADEDAGAQRLLLRIIRGLLELETPEVKPLITSLVEECQQVDPDTFRIVAVLIKHDVD